MVRIWHYACMVRSIHQLHIYNHHHRTILLYHVAMENFIYKITQLNIYCLQRVVLFAIKCVLVWFVFGVLGNICNFPKKMSSDLLLFPLLTAVVSFCQPLFYANFCIPRQFSAVCSICESQLYFKFHCFCGINALFQLGFIQLACLKMLTNW